MNSNIEVNNDRTLIQLISAQAMPNLLAAMALKPSKIIHCCTPSMKKQSNHLAKAYKTVGLRTSIEIEQLSAMPRVAELKVLIENIIQQNPNTALNFTGGTKLMSLGAFVGALNKIPSLYVDTTDGIFVDGQTAPGFNALFQEEDISLSQVKRQLTVNTVAVANGCERATGGASWEQYKELAELLLLDEALEQKCHKKATDLLKQEPRNFEKANAFWRNIIKAPLSFEPSVLELGSLSGLFEERNGAYYLHSDIKQKLDALGSSPTVHDYMKTYNALRFPFSFFQGMWWEIAVIDYLQQQGTYRDLRWSVEVGSRGAEGTNMEEDILAVDDVNLLYVSCKRGGAKAQLSRTVEDVNSSAQRIGGSHAKKIFAVCLPLKGQLRSRLHNRCKELRIELIDRNTLLSAYQAY